MRFRHYLLLFALLLFITSIPSAVFARTQIIETWVEYNFGEQVTFRARLESDVPIETAVIFFQGLNDPHTNVGQAAVEYVENNVYDLTYVHNLSDYSLRAFSNVDYRFEVTLDNGEIYANPPSSFYYQDNRFDWELLDEGPFRVYWYDGDLSFAQSVLDAAQSGLIEAQNLLPLPAPRMLDIYVYPEAALLQDTLHPASENWIAGHADPDLGVIVVALPDGPEQPLLMQQRIPHELVHILLYQATNLGYDNLPTWLKEGLSSLSELYPNPDYQLLLEDAISKESLLPMSSLCETFPRDASNALLSYAQATSFTRYLYEAYGTSGLQNLLTNYANGLDCERGAKAALGKSLTELDREWQQNTQAEKDPLTALSKFLPWIILLATVLATQFGLLFYRMRRQAINHATSTHAS